MKTPLIAVVLGMLISVLLAGVTACAPVSSASAAAKAQALAKVDKINADQIVKDAQGAADPVRHPFSAINNFVKSMRGPLTVICIVSIIALGIAIGLDVYDPCSLTRWATFGSGGVLLLTLTLSVLLPFVPWILLAIAALLLAGVIVDVVRYYKSAGKSATVGGAVKALETDAETAIGEGAGVIRPTITADASAVAAAIKTA